MVTKARVLTSFLLLILVCGLSFSIDIGSCPFLINSSGNYDVVADLDNSAGVFPCIILFANNTVLNLTGHSIQNGNAGGILVGDTATTYPRNITIVDGVIRNMAYTFGAIEVNGANDSLIQNITIYNTSSYGIRLQPAFINGPENSAVNTTLRYVHIYNMTSAGVSFTVRNVTVRDSDISNITGSAIYLGGGSSGTNITNSTFFNTTGYSMNFQTCSASVTNITSGFYGYPVAFVNTNRTWLENGTYSEIFLCSNAHNVTIQNVSVDNYARRTGGIDFISTAGNNLIANSTVNGTKGIVIDGNGGSPTTLVNVVLKHSSSGISSSLGSSSPRFTMINVTVFNNTGSGFSQGEAPLTIINSSFYNNSQAGIALSGAVSNLNLSNVNVSNNIRSGISIDFSGYGFSDGTNNVFDSIVVTGNGQYGILLAGWSFVGTPFGPVRTNISNSRFSYNALGDLVLYYSNRTTITNTTFATPSSTYGAQWYPLYVNISENTTLNGTSFLPVGNSIILNASRTVNIYGSLFNDTNVSVSFSYANFSVAAENVLPSSAPSGSSIAKMVNITNKSGAAAINLSIFYDDASVASYTESSVSLYLFNRSDSSWSYVASQTLDTTNKFVNISAFGQFGTFALFANSSASPSSGSTTVSGDSSDDRLPLVVEYSLDQQTGELGLHVTDTRGDVQSGVRILLTSPYLGQIDDVQTDSNGRLEYLLSQSGEYTLVVSASGHKQTALSLALDLPVFGRQTLDVLSNQMCNPAASAVTVTSQGAPVDNAMVLFEGADGSVLALTTGVSGIATVASASSGTVTVSKEGYEDTSAPVDAPSCKSSFTYSLAALCDQGAYSLMVSDSQSGSLLKGVHAGDLVFDSGAFRMNFGTESDLLLSKEGYYPHTIGKGEFDAKRAACMPSEPVAPAECAPSLSVPREGIAGVPLEATVSCTNGVGVPENLELEVVSKDRVVDTFMVRHGNAQVRIDLPGEYSVRFKTARESVASLSIRASAAKVEEGSPVSWLWIILLVAAAASAGYLILRRKK